MEQPITKPQAIRNLQRYLRRLSFDSPTIPRVPIDGIFESATEDAVKAFQAEYGLPVTGRADKRTWDRLYLEFLRVEEKNDRTPILHLFPTAPPNYVLEEGEESLTVMFLQIFLRELGIIYDAFEDMEITGRYDAPTAQNVRIFQEASLLPITGKVDLVTWNRILRDYTHYAQ